MDNDYNSRQQGQKGELNYCLLKAVEVVVVGLGAGDNKNVHPNTPETGLLPLLIYFNSGKL